MKSNRWQWNYQDTFNWLRNALWFLVPTLLVFLPSLAGLVDPNWKYAVVTLYVLNRITDALRKLYAGPQ